MVNHIWPRAKVPQSRRLLPKQPPVADKFGPEFLATLYRHMTTKIDGPTCSGAAGGVPLDIAVPASCRSHIIAYNDVDSADTAQMTTAVGVRLWIYGDNIRRHSTPILFIFSRIRCVRAYACICVCACMHERICFCIGMSWHTPVVCRECSQYSFRVHIVC